MTKVDEYRARIAAAWEPTLELRWLVGSVPLLPVLQQRWHNSITDEDEWRDVPMVEEQ